MREIRDEFVERFEISVPPLNTTEFYHNWELCREAHNGFDNYLAYELLEANKQIQTKDAEIERLREDKQYWTRKTKAFNKDNKTLTARIELLTRCRFIGNAKGSCHVNNCQPCENKALLEKDKK
jgi:hypothetical protein